MSRNKEHRPNGAAAEGGAFVFFVSAHYFLYYKYFRYFLYIPYIFHKYFPYVGPWAIRSGTIITLFAVVSAFYNLCRFRVVLMPG